MRARWLEQSEEGPLQRMALAPLSAVAAAYGLGARLHRALRVPAERLDCRVVTVGSPVVGGSGKTPLAAWIAAALRDSGARVAVASRGYGRRRGAPRIQVVSDGERVCASVDEAGDEPLWLAARLPGVPVLVGADRLAVGRRAIAWFGTEILVLDDGLQHRRLTSDVRVATLDAGVGLGNGWVLPRGPLREPLAALAQVDALAVLGVGDGALSAVDSERLTRVAPGLARFVFRRRASGLRPVGLGGSELLPVSTLASLEVGVLCGIAQPARLVAMLEGLGAKVIAVRAFGDHHRFRRADLRGLRKIAPIWITTEKDAVKLRADWAREIDLRILSCEVEPVLPRDFLSWLQTRLAD